MRPVMKLILRKSIMKKIEAPTLEQAYAKAAAEFGCSVTALQVEIVQFPSKGVLGLFKKSAIIIANLPHTASAAVEEMVEEVSKLSVLELSELVNALQDKLGVSAAMPVAAAAPVAGAAPAEGAAAADDGGLKTVVMTDSGANKIAVIKALREIDPNLTLMDAKGMTEALPAEVLKDAKAEDAKAANDKLTAAGAKVELK